MNKRIRRRLFVVLFILVYVFLYVGTVTYAQTYDCANNKHNLVMTDKVEATETTDGYIIYTCLICHETFRVNIFATGHTWSEWAVERQPTCTVPGIRSRTCDKDIPHKEEIEIPATGHSYKETIIPATCTERGKKIYTCTVCGYSYTEMTENALGHTYIESNLKQATCTESGLIEYTCEVCGDIYTKKTEAALGHQYVETIIISAENPHELTHMFTCSVCGDSYSKVEYTPHSYGEWIIEENPQKNVNGRQYRECSICGEREYQILPALSHTQFTFGVVEGAVTAANGGVIILFVFLLWGEMVVWRWRRRKQREALKGDADNDDGYQYI